MHQCTIRIGAVLLFQRPSYFRGHVFLITYGGNRVTNKKEKAELLNAFFSFLLQSGQLMSGCPAPELEDREQNEAAIIQGEMVSDLLCHFDT